MDINIGEKIKELRLSQKITQDEVASYIGVTYQAVSKWETGTTMPDITLLPKLASLFGVRIDELFNIDRTDELERVDSILYHESLSEKSYNYAKNILESILSENENNVGALKRYSELILKRNAADLIQVRKMLERVMKQKKIDPEVVGLYRRACGGNREVVRSNNDTFINTLEKYPALVTESDKTIEPIIEAMIDMHYYDRAQKLIEKFENKTLTFLFTGDILVSKGNISEAKKAWENIPKSDHKGQYELGERFNSLCEYERAEKCYKNSFDSSVYPRDLSALYSLAFLYEKFGKKDKAVSTWEKIIDVLKTDHNITDGEAVDWPKREIKKLKQ